MKSRDKDIAYIRQSDRAAAVGRLMLGEFDDWIDFLSADTRNLENLPRRNLKAGRVDVRRRRSKEILRFCNDNFIEMDQGKLSNLYDLIKARRGCEMPLREFESRYAKVRDRVLGGQPRHCTVVISLWGLQFKFPERKLANDVIEALSLIRSAERNLAEHKERSHRSAVAARDEISSATRQAEFAARMCVLSCFNLVEAFLNGLAWDFSRTPENLERLSERSRKLLQNGSIRDKIIRYPEIIAEAKLWDDQIDPAKRFLEHVKPFRDSLVHPSPFSTPERYGGHDKLEHLYRIDAEKAEQAASVSVEVIRMMLKHVRGSSRQLPEWLQDLLNAVSPSIPRGE